MKNSLKPQYYYQRERKKNQLLSFLTKLEVKKRNLIRLNKMAFLALFVASSREENQPIKI